MPDATDVMFIDFKTDCQPIQWLINNKYDRISMCKLVLFFCKYSLFNEQ